MRSWTFWSLGAGTLVVGWLVVAVPDMAAADARTEAAVHSFLSEGQARSDQLSASPAELRAHLGRYFSMVDLAWRTAPRAAWDAASPQARLLYSEVVLCRLAQTRLVDIEEIEEWRILGSRDTDTISTVAVSTTDANGRTRRVLFDLGRVHNRIIDVRSDGGRLSYQLAQDFLREAGYPNQGASVTGWLERVKCVAGRS